jgi:hypothetical protein
MEQLNQVLDTLLTRKAEEVVNILNSKVKNAKMTDSNNINDIDYHSKTTLSKIAAEQDRKLKSSKAYKNQQNYAS